MYNVNSIIFTGLFLVACGGGASAAPSATTPKSTLSSGDTPAKDEGSDLETKRQTDKIQEGLPKQRARFTQVCGGQIDIEIDWTSFGHEKAALERLSSNYGAPRMIDAFEKVCRDKNGKDAVTAKIKKVKIVNAKDPSNVKVTVADGTVTVALNYSASDPGMNENAIGAAITKNL